MTKKNKFPISTFPKGWPYSSDAPENKKWQKDRSDLFAESGNGWWWYAGSPQYVKHLEEINKRELYKGELD